MGRRIPCSIGRSGFRNPKREGDGGTPMQAMQMVGGAFRSGRIFAPVCPFPMHPIGPADVWSDDSEDPDYNQKLSSREHLFSHEMLYRSDPLYDIVIFTDYNYPSAISGAGSAIFIHQWRKSRHPTEGCIAFSRTNLRWILERWTQRSCILVSAYP